MCIVFGDEFWKQEWLREATDDVHNGLAMGNVVGSSMQKRLAVANLALHSLAGIDDNSRETLEFIKQEDATQFEIAMDTNGKSFKELSARRNNIARISLEVHVLFCVIQFDNFHLLPGGSPFLGRIGEVND